MEEERFEAKKEVARAIEVDEAYYSEAFWNMIHNKYEEKRHNESHFQDKGKNDPSLQKITKRRMPLPKFTKIKPICTVFEPFPGYMFEHQPLKGVFL